MASSRLGHLHHAVISGDCVGKLEDYARGVMASQFSPPDIQTEELQSRFPARSLYGLGPGLIWEPPEQYEETMASLRRRELLQNRNNVEKNDGVDR